MAESLLDQTELGSRGSIDVEECFDGFFFRQLFFPYTALELNVFTVLESKRGTANNSNWRVPRVANANWLSL